MIMNKKLKAILPIPLINLAQRSDSQENDEINYHNESIHIDMHPEEVWDLIKDVSIWKIWDNRIIDVDFDGPLTKKARGRLLTYKAHLVKFIISDLVEGRAYTLKHKLSSGMLYMKRSIQAANSGSIITQEVWIKGLSPKTIKKYLGEEYGLAIRNSLENLKEYMDNTN